MIIGMVLGQQKSLAHMALRDYIGQITQLGASMTYSQTKDMVWVNT